MLARALPFLFFLTVSLTAAPALAQTPGLPVYWVSDPVNPGETVMVAGGGWGESVTVEAARLSDGTPGRPPDPARPAPVALRELPTLQVTPTATKFLLPRDWKPGLVAFRLNSGTKSSDLAWVNAPDPWWLQGDWGREASPGGWLRVLGRCLSFEDRATVVLRAGGRDHTLRPDRQDLWSLSLPLPDDLRPAEYQVFVHNGYGGALGWREAGEVRIAPHPPLWKPQEFNVQDFGAYPQDHQDDSAAFQAALDAAGDNGGGLVYVPTGRYQINQTLQIPRRVLLRGAGPGLSVLYWRDRMTPLPTLLQGTDSFGVEDLTLYATNHLEGISSDREGAGNIFLRRVHLMLNRYVQISPTSPLGWSETERRTGGWVHALHLTGENVQVTDCEVYSSTSAFHLGGSHVLIRGNRFSSGRWNSWVIHGAQVICEDNEMIGNDNQTWGGCNYPRQHSYFARNRVGRGFGGDRELFTTDGAGVPYLGPVASVEGTRMLLAEDPLWHRQPWDWLERHTGAFIMAGTGAGQMRELVSYEGRNIEVDRPWDILPDDTSVLYLSRRNSHHLIVDNEWFDATIAIQAYVEADHWVIAGNTSTRAGGFQAQGFAAMPCWFVQFLDNRLLDGSGFSGPWNDQPPVDSHIAFQDKGGYWFWGARSVPSPTVRYGVMRRNELLGNARLLTGGQVQDTLIENNLVRNSQEGLLLGERHAGTVVLGNRFEEVRRPLSGALDAALFHPAELLLAQLSAPGLIPSRLAATTPWRQAWQRLEALAAEPPTAPGLAERVGRTQTDLLQAAAAVSADYSLAFLEALTGLSLRYASAPLQPLLATGAGGEGGLLIMAFLRPDSPALSVSLEFPPLPGVEIAPARNLTPEPGGRHASATPLARLAPGLWGKPTVPVNVTLSADDWQLTGAGAATLDLGPTDFITQWSIVGPFRSDRPGELGDQVYPPHHRLDLAAEYPGLEGPVRWQPVDLGARPQLDFAEYFGKPESGVAFAVAALRVSEPTPVAITFEPSSPAQACYLNGEKLGVPFRYGNRRVARILPPGEHILLTGMALRDGNWTQSVQVEVLRSAAPGAVQMVPAAELAQVAALRPEGLAAAPEGPGLPFSEGVDWRLVFEDRFNRNWLGTDWRPVEGKWAVNDGLFVADHGFAYLAYARPLPPPLRVEAEIAALPDRGRNWMWGFCLTPENQVAGRALWYTLRGAGYMLGLGWHDRLSNQLWRGAEEIQVRTEPPFLQPGGRHHLIAQFLPPRVMLVLDGELVLDHTDSAWLPDLDTFSFFSGWARDRLELVRLYRPPAA